MCGLLGLDRSSPCRLSALGLGLGLRAGQRTRATDTGQTRAHCPPSVAAGRWGIEVRLERRNVPCCKLRRAARAARAAGAGARPLCRGPAGFGGALPSWAWRSGRRRGVRKTAERRAAGQFGPAPTWRLRLSGRLVRVDEAREYRLNNRGRMELIQAVQEQDVEKVKVRRLLEAVSSTGSGPSRAVCLGLGQWTLDAVVARPIRPSCVEPARTSGTSQAILMLHAGAPPCRSGRQVP